MATIVTSKVTVEVERKTRSSIKLEHLHGSDVAVLSITDEVSYDTAHTGLNLLDLQELSDAISTIRLALQQKVY